VAERNRTVVILASVVAVLVVVVALLVVAIAALGIFLTRSDDSSGSGPKEDRSAPSTSAGATTPEPGTGTIPPVATSTTSTPAGPVSFQDVTIQEGVMQRQYLVLRPADAPLDRPMPVVMALHGLTVDRWGAVAAAPWAESVARDGYIAVFPQGVLSSWNLGPCCPPASLANIDDVGFLSDVVAQLRQRPDVNAKRIYLTGFSNGGMMAYALACARTDDFAAVAPMASTNLTECAPSKPISLLHMHGDPDPTVPYDGGPSLAQIVSAKPFPAIPPTVAAWAKADGCAGGPDRTEAVAGVKVDTWSGCPAGIRVELITHPGNAHTWPKVPFDGLAAMLAFFDIGN
jgi:polyhydroxybutyrate depolymerase